MKWLARAALVLVAAGCSSGPRAPAGMGFVGPLMFEPPPIYALLGYRSDLNLTSEQVAALDSIAVNAREELGPLVRAFEERAGRQRGALRIDENEDLVEAVRASQLRASEAVAEVLEEDQRDRVCRLFEPRRPASPPGGVRTRQPGPMPADSAAAASRASFMSTWSWCRPPAPEAQA